MARTTRPPGAASAFPTREESLALQASLLDGERALEAWRKLSKTTAPEDAGIGWIAPLLMANLSRLLPQDPWVRDHPHSLTLCDLNGRALTAAAQAILLFFEKAGIMTMALKGLALGATVYPSPGLRPVSDLDILVPAKDLFHGIEILKAHGLKSGPGEPRSEKDLRKNHAHAFQPSKRHELTIDLHWHVLASARGDDDDSFFWSGSEALTIGRVGTRCLCPEDQLLHALVHGVRWTRMPHVRWVADTAMILRRSVTTFRVERFVEGLLRFDAVTPAQEGLGFVVDLLGEGQELLERVRTLKRTRFSARAFKARATAYEDRSASDRLALRIESAVWSRRASRPPDPGRRRG